MKFLRRRPPRCGVIVAMLAMIFIDFCRGDEVTFNVAENSDEDTEIGHLPPGQNYQLMENNEYIYLDFGSQTLKVKKKIDRETIEYDVIELVAQSTEDGSNLLDISVQVTDENDNPPYFSPDFVNISISESAKKSSEFPLPIAKDNDLPPNKVTTKYAIVDGDTNVFDLTTTALDFGDYSVSLKLKQELNREEKSHYELRVSATDDGTPSNTGYLLVNVHVSDVNDNAPKFDAKEYTASIAEDASVGDHVITVQATDKDEGSNGEITYSISEDRDEGIFTIDNSTGGIYLLKPLDYERKKTYRMDVTATDNGEPAMYRVTSVTVDVTNVNDNPPEIKFTYIPVSASVANVDEDAEIGTLVALLSITDADVDMFVQPEPITLELIQGNEKGNFKLENIGNFAKVLVDGPISLEDERSYNLTFKSKDEGQNISYTSFSSLEIVVNSQNLHPPVFNDAHYIFYVKESACIGSVVGAVEATDSDAGIPGRLIYSILHGNDNDWFEMDEQGGLIITKIQLLFDKVSNGTVELTIHAQDETTNPLNSQTIVTINILDENNHAPMFHDGVMNFTVNENYAGPIVTVVAIDNDYGINGQVVYDLLSIKPLKYAPGACIDCNYLSSFQISRSTGELQTLKELDREHISEYELIISAKDNGRETLLSSTCTVVITVRNENDNLPIFLPDIYVFSVAQSDHIIGRVSAVDKDEDADIKYVLVSSSAENVDVNYFQAVENTGEIISLVNLQVNSYTLVIKAIDSDGKSSDQHATVYVDVTSSITTIETKTINMVVYQGAENGYSVGKIPLKNSNKLFKTNGNDKDIFNINNLTGELTVHDSSLLKVQLSLSSIMQLLEVTEGQNSFLKRDVEWRVNIQILPQNVYLPVFDQLKNTAKQISHYYWTDSVEIFTPVYRDLSTVLYNAHVKDEDKNNGSINYAVITPFPGVQIDRNGMITLLSNGFFNYNYLPQNQMQFTVSVRACESFTATKCSTLSLTVNLNLFHPFNLIKQPNIFIQLPEEEQPHSIVHDLNLNDVSEVCFLPEVLSYMNITFELSQPNEFFEIFPSGQVYLRRKLNYGSYEISFQIRTWFVPDEVIIYDSTLYVQVMDTNNRQPVFVNTPVIMTVAEGTESYTVISKINVTDGDSKANAQAYFSLSDYLYDESHNVLSANFFGINQYTGDVYSTVDLSRENYKLLGLIPDPIVFTVSVEDLQKPGKILSINVTMVTEFQVHSGIAFNKTVYKSSMFENEDLFDLKLNAFNIDFPWERSEIYYQISDCLNCGFTINPLTGEINTDNKLNMDFSGNKEIVFKVIAHANDDAAIKSEANVKVLLLKDRIYFDQDIYNFTVSENARINSVVGKLTPICPNCKGQLQFSFKHLNKHFQVDSETGIILLQSELDYETEDDYNMTVVVYDENGHSARCDVIINVLNINDNKPTFTNVSWTLDETEFQEITLLGSISATDADSTKTPTYDIIHVSPMIDAAFTINEFGEIFVSGNVDSELLHENQITLTIRAYDPEEKNSLQHSTDQNFVIHVTDRNDNLPFLVGSSSALVPYDLGIGAIVLNVGFFDPDKIDSNNVVMEITPDKFDAEYFGMTSDEKNIIVHKALPPDQIVFDIELKLKNGGNTASENVKVISIIQYSGDFSNGPVFDKSFYTVNITTSMQTGNHILTVSTNSQANFYITKISNRENGDKNIPLIFSMERNTGALNLQGKLGYFGVKNFQLEVVAVDKTSSPQMSKVKVNINVFGLKSDIPQLFPATQRVKISSKAAPNTVIASMSENKEGITFSIKDIIPDLPVFKIDSENGNILIREGLAAKNIDFYQIEVKGVAADGQSTFAEVLVDVELENNILSTLQSLINMFVPENSYEGFGVGAVNVLGGDGLKYTTIEDSSNGMFNLNEDTGIISKSSTGILDRETVDFYSLNVNVESGEGSSTSVQVFITVTDINDHSPIFVDTTDDEGFHTKAFATDSDTGRNSEILYTIIGGNDKNEFWIDEYSGRIINEEGVEDASLTIMACDCAIPTYMQRCTEKTVLVKGNKQSGSQNIIISLPNVWYIEENASNNTELFKIRIINLASMETSSVSYQLNWELPCTWIFNMEKTSGSLFVHDNRMLNRETITKCQMTGFASVKDKSANIYTESFNFTIHVIGVNEFSPTFKQSQYSFTIAETSEVGMLLGSVKANDADKGLNGKVVYSLAKSEYSSSFDVNRYSGNIYLLQKMSYEKTKELTLQISASNINMGGSKSTVDVAITLTQANNKPPYINPPYALVTVNENAGKTSLVHLTVSPDDGNTEIRSANVIFPIDHDFQSDDLELKNEGQTTEVILRKSLDYETASEYQIRVEAVSLGTEIQKAYSIISIQVENLNDNEVAFEQNAYKFFVHASNVVGDIIGQVIAFDEDSCQIIYKVFNSDYFTVNPDTGEISIKSEPDASTSFAFEVNAFDCKDNNNVQTNATASVSVIKIVSNVNTPRFSNYIYEGSLTEDDENKVIITVDAIDIAADSSKLRYELVSSNDDDLTKFEINNNGEIKNTQRLDRETKAKYVLQVVALNVDQVGVTATSRVEIIVEDINDEFPMFTGLYKAQVREDALLGQFIVQVTAVDKDSTSTVFYMLSEDANGTFSIDRNTGDIFLAKKLDREIIDSYILKVDASDGNLLTHTSVTVQVLDINDEAPKFKEASYNTYIYSSIIVGDVVMNLTATDADDGESGKVFYRIVNDNYHFDINNDGQIHLIHSFQCWENEEYYDDCPLVVNFEVIATDGGYPNALSSKVYVKVIIVQDKPALNDLYEDTQYEIPVLKTLDVGSKLYQPLDVGRSVVFNILPGEDDQYFTCDSETGDISLSSPVVGLNTAARMTAGPRLNIVLYAVERKFPFRASLLNLVFEITNDNLHRPEFTQEEYTSEIENENASVGSFIVTVQADDEDVGINGQVLYEITDGNINDVFQINKTTGTITTAKQLDYESVPRYQLTVTARDKATFSKSSNCSVIVPIRDLNDNVPYFQMKKTVIVITENTQIHSIIGHVSAIDEDSGQNGIISYSIKPLDEFAVSTLTGDIYTVKDFDYEAKMSYKVVISAKNEDNDLSSSIDVFIYLQPVNEFAPSFIHNTFQYNYATCSNNDTITTLSVFDIDRGDETEFYIINGVDQGIVIDKTSGELKFTEPVESGDTKSVEVLIKNKEQLLNENLRWNTAVVNVTIKSCKCENNSCMNGGTCESDSKNTFRCLCPQGFTGAFCETTLPTCECVNGVCDNGQCVCDALYTGERCDVVLETCDGYCFNGGLCKANASGLSCECQTNYTGARCEDYIPCLLLACGNKGTNFVCMKTTMGAFCSCGEGSKEVDNKCVRLPKEALLKWWQILIIAIALVVTACAVAIILFCYRKKNKKINQTRNMSLSMVAMNGTQKSTKGFNNKFNDESLSTPASISKQESFASADMKAQIGVINDIVGLTADEIDLLNLGGNQTDSKYAKKRTPLYNEDAASVTAYSLSSENSSKVTTDMMSTQVTTLSNTSSSLSNRTTVGSSVAPSTTRSSHPEDWNKPSMSGMAVAKVVMPPQRNGGPRSGASVAKVVMPPRPAKALRTAENISIPQMPESVSNMFNIPAELHPTKQFQPPSDTSSCNSFSDEEDDVPHPMDLIMIQMHSQLRPKSTTDNATSSNSSSGTHLTNLTTPAGYNTMTEYYASLIERSEKLSESLSEETDAGSQSTISSKQHRHNHRESHASSGSSSSRNPSFTTFKEPSMSTHRVIPLPTYSRRRHEEFV